MWVLPSYTTHRIVRFGYFPGKRAGYRSVSTLHDTTLLKSSAVSLTVFWSILIFASFVIHGPLVSADALSFECI